MIKLFSKAEDNFKSVGILSIDGHFRESGPDKSGERYCTIKDCEGSYRPKEQELKESMKIEKQDSVFPEPAPPLTIQFKTEGEFLTLLGKLETAFKSNIEKGKMTTQFFYIQSNRSFYGYRRGKKGTFVREVFAG